MARKRFNFHLIVESFLSNLQLIPRSWSLKNYWCRRILFLFFLGVLIAVGIDPASSQISPFKPINQEIINNSTLNNNTCYEYEKGEIDRINDVQKLMQDGKNCYELGNFYHAKIILENATKILESQSEFQKDKQINLAITYANLSLVYQQLTDNLPSTATAILPQLNKSNQELAQSSIALGFNILNTNPNINKTKKQQILAQLWNIQGRLQFSQGKLEAALKSWEKATAIYESIGNTDGTISSQINQVQSLQSLGLFQPAKAKIEAIARDIKTLPNNLKSKILRSLGNVLYAMGDLDRSEKTLNDSLAYAKTAKDKNAAFLSLGNTLWAKANLETNRIAPANYEYIPWRCEKKNLTDTVIKKYDEAIKQYNQVIENKPLVITESKVKLNLLHLFIDKGEISQANKLLNEINFDKLPNSRSKIYAEINFARSLACLQQESSQIKLTQEQIIRKYNQVILKLQTVITAAEQLKDSRAKSYALGSLGGLYEYFSLVSPEPNQRDQWREKAKKLTEEALYLAQPGEMSDVAYQWQWQLGRLFNSENNNNAALKEYKNAVQTLNLVRGDLLTINSDVQFNFRDNVEPLYRQLINLLLQTSDSLHGVPSQENLQNALDLMDSLRLAELQNFLGCDLSAQSKNQSQKITSLDSEVAFIYTIILNRRLGIILKLPNQENYIYRDIQVNSTDIDKITNGIQNDQNRISGKTQVDKYGKELYRWLIQPIELELENHSLDTQNINQFGKIKTLVFSLDGSLRNISLSALVNGQGKYLIQKYAIATTYSSNLTQQSSDNQRPDVITAGITEQRLLPKFGKFDPLPNVKNELPKVHESIKSTNQPLLNEDFTLENLRNRINNSKANILHIATHGKFDSDPSRTFLLAWDNVINAKNFNDILRKNNQGKNDKFDLLVLSACETAKGDRRAILGLAGIAVEAGVNTILSSLWTINDQATTEFMEQFYKNLITNNLYDVTISNVAIALQKTQLYFLDKSNIPGKEEYSRPYYWSAFTIVGN